MFCRLKNIFPSTEPATIKLAAALADLKVNSLFNLYVNSSFTSQSEPMFFIHCSRFSIAYFIVKCLLFVFAKIAPFNKTYSLFPFIKIVPDISPPLFSNLRLPEYFLLDFVPI